MSQVPWKNVANFEVLLANEKAPVAAGQGPVAKGGGESPWEQRMRWLKVGAAAVGGGALFAVTGEGERGWSWVREGGEGLVAGIVHLAPLLCFLAPQPLWTRASLIVCKGWQTKRVLYLATGV